MKKINSGEAFNKLVQLVAAQGGDIRTIKDYSLLPKAKQVVAFVANKAWLY